MDCEKIHAKKLLGYQNNNYKINNIKFYFGWHATRNASPREVCRRSTAFHVVSISNADELKKYVRVLRVRENKYIEFQFAISDPELYVELILPRDAFDEFCRTNDVVMLAGEH